MAVRDVFEPKRTKTIDPMTSPPENSKDAAEYWHKQAEAIRAKREYLEEQRMAEKATTAPVTTPQDAGFQVKGSVDLGNFSLTQQLNEIKQEAQQQAQFLQQKVEKAEADRDNARDSLLQANLKMMQDGFQRQIDLITKTIERVNENKPTTLREQLSEINELAGALGYNKIQGGGGNGDLGLQLEIIKLQNQESRAKREFEWQMEQDKFNRELQMEQHKASILTERQKIQADQEKTKMWAKFPQMIGAAAAQGIQHMGGNPITGKPPQQQTAYQIEAQEGESGQVQCPECGNAMTFGPTSPKTICAGCGLEVAIKRIAGNTETPGLVLPGINTGGEDETAEDNSRGL